MQPKISSNALKLVQTGLICPMFLVTGCILGIMGPSLMDLQMSIGASLQETAYIVPSRALCYAIGSIIGGFSRKLARLEITLAVSIAISAVSMGLAPFCKTLLHLLIAAGISGFFMGAVDTLANVLLLDIWKEQSGSVIQFGYFFYGLGAFLSPLFVAPFLLPVEVEEDLLRNSTELHRIEHLPIQIPYTVIGICGLCCGLVFLLLNCFTTRRDVVDKSQEEKAPEVNYRMYILAVALGGIVVHLYFGTVTAIGTMLETFLVMGEAKMSKTSAAFLTSAFWAGYAFFRLGTWLLTHLCGPSKTMLFEMIIVVVGNVILIWLRHYNVFLWVSIILLGIGFSSQFGLVVAYMQQFVKITPNVMSFFLIIACFAEFLYPTIVAAFVESNPEVFVHLTVLCSVVMCVSCALLAIVCRRL